MLFVSTDTSHPGSFYVKVLAKLLRLPEFKDLQIVSASGATVSSLKLESLPLLMDDLGNRTLSLQAITEKLCKMVKSHRILVGEGENAVSSTFKWFELAFGLE